MSEGSQDVLVAMDAEPSDNILRSPKSRPGGETEGVELTSTGADSAEAAPLLSSGGGGGGGGAATAEGEGAAAEAPLRTEEQKKILREKLERFYARFNPEMLEGEHIDKILESRLTDRQLFQKLVERYCQDDDDDDAADAHPKIVGEKKSGPSAQPLPRMPRGGHAFARRFSDHTMALFVPVSITMFIAVWAVTNFTSIQDNPDVQPIYLPTTESESDSGGTKLGKAVINGLVVVAFFGVVTVLMVILYKYNCMFIIKGWLITSSALILYFMGWIWFDLFLTKYQIPYDMLTCALVMLNFGTVGVICIYFRGHPKMTQGYLVATAAIMAWFLSRLPEWTTWVLLVLVAIYDLAAVLTPKGPLKVLVEESQKRNEPIPGLVYESKQFKLGLGDFVFYSVLVARSAVFDYTTWVVSFLAVLTGLSATLCCLGLMKKPLPALPISIALGVAFHFLARFLLLPYEEQFFLDRMLI